MTNFLKKAFNDMKESAKLQHEVDKANFAAVKAESKAEPKSKKSEPKKKEKKEEKKFNISQIELFDFE